MNSLSSTSALSSVPLQRPSIDEMAKELCHIIRTAIRSHARTIEWHKERTEETSLQAINNIAASQRSWVGIVGRISSTCAGIIAQVGVQALMGSEAHRDWAQAIQGLSQAAGTGFDLHENYKSADRTEWQASSDRARRLSEDAARQRHDLQSQLDELLKTIRQIDDERAQTMRSLRN